MKITHFLFLLSFLFFGLPAYAEDYTTWETRKEVVYSLKFSNDQSKARKGHYNFYAPEGWRFCYVTTNELSANPKGYRNGGNTDYSIKATTPASFDTFVTLPCAGGGIDGVFITAAGIVAAIYAPQYAADIAGGVRTVEEKVLQCGITGKSSWLDLQYVAVVVPVGQQCPKLCGGKPCTHPVPWVIFPQDQSGVAAGIIINNYGKSEKLSLRFCIC